MNDAIRCEHFANAIVQGKLALRDDDAIFF
jgi:hypothetical protein